MWIWLDPERRPGLRRCEARRLADGARPEGQRGFVVVEFRGRMAMPEGLAGPMRLRVSADTSYRLRLGGADLAAGPAPAPGDWLALPRLACWYADEVVVARPPQGLAEFSAIELSKMLAGNTASVSPYIRNLDNGFSCGCTPKDLERMFQRRCR